jgi:hypothetical protein
MKVMDFLFPRHRNHAVSDSALPSFLHSLMTSTNANAASVLQMLDDESHDNCRHFLFQGHQDDDNNLDDDERSTNDHVFRHLFTPAPPVLEEPPVPMNQQIFFLLQRHRQGRNLGGTMQGNLIMLVIGGWIILLQRFENITSPIRMDVLR